MKVDLRNVRKQAMDISANNMAQIEAERCARLQSAPRKFKLYLNRAKKAFPAAILAEAKKSSSFSVSRLTVMGLSGGGPLSREKSVLRLVPDWDYYSALKQTNHLQEFFNDERSSRSAIQDDGLLEFFDELADCGFQPFIAHPCMVAIDTVGYHYEFSHWVLCVNHSLPASPKG